VDADVVEALTYYGHREKLRIVGKEDALEELNLAALKIAREVVDATGSLFAGNICNCTSFLIFHSLFINNNFIDCVSLSTNVANLWEGANQSAEVTQKVRFRTLNYTHTLTH
jgi:methionine synthase I (cobalamin-dependent)